jgi:hypothetical protein
VTIAPAHVDDWGGEEEGDRSKSRSARDFTVFTRLP